MVQKDHKVSNHFEAGWVNGAAVDKVVPQRQIHVIVIDKGVEQQETPAALLHLHLRVVVVSFDLVPVKKVLNQCFVEHEQGKDEQKPGSIVELPLENFRVKELFYQKVHLLILVLFFRQVVLPKSCCLNRVTKRKLIAVLAVGKAGQLLVLALFFVPYLNQRLIELRITFKLQKLDTVSNDCDHPKEEQASPLEKDTEVFLKEWLNYHWLKLVITSSIRSIPSISIVLSSWLFHGFSRPVILSIILIWLSPRLIRSFINQAISLPWEPSEEWMNRDAFLRPLHGCDKWILTLLLCPLQEWVLKSNLSVW